MLPLEKYRLNYSIRRYYVDEFMCRTAREFPPRCRVLDLGGHKYLKRGRFDIEQYGLDVIYADLAVQKRPDVQADAAHIPYHGESFDAVLCTELLEHVPDPRLVLEEANRVLRIGGKLVITAPFLYPVHADPYDFGRYTDHYWTEILAELGFHEIRVERHGLFYTVILSYFKHYLGRHSMNGPIHRLICRLLSLVSILPIQFWAQRYESSDTARRSQFLQSYTTGFGIIGVKQ
jgi:SAM-dependent methyltransferase